MRAIILLAAILLALPARAADPALQQAMLAEVNAIRARAGRAPLTLDPRLSRAALDHSFDMLRRNQLGHAGSDGSDPGRRITRAGFAWRSYRENVGAGYQDLRQAMAGWMNSPGHRDNILAADVTQVGLGFAAGPGLMPGNIPRLFWTMVLAAPR
ncbi:CAP domain-containing protein [Roseomonas rosulenta]|uniref:CAP domain-containing protein n=1 Tax=Roseomonas rosulenta TaxID=2748667 RepID=UPI0018DF2092